MRDILCLPFLALVFTACIRVGSRTREVRVDACGVGGKLSLAWPGTWTAQSVRVCNRSSIVLSYIIALNTPLRIIAVLIPISLAP